MKSSLQTLQFILGAMLILSPTFARAQSPKDQPATTQAQREQQLQTRLTQAVLAGRWSSVSKDGLGPVHEDRYTLQGVSKVGGDVWLVRARIQYGAADSTVPVPVKVTWVDGTPVLHITDLAIPGVGTYTARIVIQGDAYAGTWSGGDHGGVMSGVIQRASTDQ